MSDLKPFDLKAALAGERVVKRPSDRETGRVVAHVPEADADSRVVVVWDSGIVCLYCEDGRVYESNLNPSLFMAPKPKPTMDRSLLPAWANNYVAMDADGEWCAYRSMPEKREYQHREGIWMPTGNPSTPQYVRIPDEFAPKWTGDWKESLISFNEQP